VRTYTQIVREGENVGPVDWEHGTARDMPAIWREAEQRPDDFTFTEYRRQIISICMYDGWPYWEPRPAVCFVGPLNCAEWAFFNGYAVGPESIQRKASVNRSPEGEDPAEGLHAKHESAVPKADAQGIRHD
jgi:hypothetical protein